MNYGIENSGVSFGQLSGIRVNWILFVLTILTSYALKCKLHNLGLLYVIIGGLGNFFTRVLFGSVWDYITVYGLPFWFNISDVLITIGIVSYILVDYGY